MSIDYGHLRRIVAEMEQGVTSTTKYSWLDLAQEVIRLREELRELRGHLKKRSEYHSKVELSTDPLDGIELEDNYAEDEISRILGDHDD